LLIRKTLAAQVILIARDDGSNRLARLVFKLGLVVRVSFKVLRVVLIITFTSLVLDQCVSRVNGVKRRTQELKDQEDSKAKDWKVKL
jgi:hypothetical protein